MTKSKENVEKSEEFIRRVLKEKFNQDVDAEELRAAAKKLCDAVPEVQRRAA